MVGGIHSKGKNMWKGLEGKNPPFEEKKGD